MRYVLIAVLAYATPLLQATLPLLPLETVEAEHIDFDEKTVHLVGNVKVINDFGTLHCNEATLVLPQGKQADDQPAVQEIFLKGAVVVDFTDGSKMMANEGEIDCRTLEGTFFAEPPEKVVYQGYTMDKDRKIPIRATGRALKAVIAKTPDGFSLASLRGEGAVNIEYLRSEPKTPSAAELAEAAPQPQEEPSL
jgi:hypothetical protein